MNFPLVASIVAAAFLASCGSPSKADPSFHPNSFPEQVTAGQSLFAANCAKCHGDSGEGTSKAPRVVGLAQGALPLDPPPERKVRKGRFVTVADVAEFAVANMPPKEGGSLSEQQYLAILAFDLKANGIDLGTQPLTMAKARELKIPR
jgi:mono/diheme cytochrome c family protein